MRNARRGCFGSGDAGKGDVPRNTGPLFRKQFDQVAWDDPTCSACSKVLCVCPTNPQE